MKRISVKMVAWGIIIASILSVCGCGNSKTEGIQMNSEEVLTKEVENPNTDEINHNIDTQDISSEGNSEDSNTENDTDLEAKEGNTDSNAEMTENMDLPDTSEEEELDEIQLNSLAMLNYLAIMTQRIQDSKSSRIYLEEAYSELINNSDPSKIDDTAEAYYMSLLDTIEKYKMIDVKRERLLYLFEEQKANAIMKALPSAISLLSLTNSKSIKGVVASLAFMGIESIVNYNNYNDTISEQYLKDGWELDDEESEALHESRKSAFTYTIDTVKEYKLPGTYSLNSKQVEDFVSEINNENITSRIQFLESEERTYSFLGLYWVELANSYFEAEEYQKCLDAVGKYEDLNISIYRVDHDYAGIIPKAIVSARECYNNDDYIDYAIKHLKALEKNTNKEDWELKYFEAQEYISLSFLTGETSYLNDAYEIVLNNVNNMVKIQKNFNNEYLSEVKEKPIPKDATDEQEAAIDEYNDGIKEARKTELPPVYAPLELNCSLLFELANEIGIKDDDKNRIDKILRSDGQPLFLVDAIENKYSFDNDATKLECEYDKNEIVVSAKYISNNSNVSVTVEHDGKKYTYTDWVVKKVKRKGTTVDSFMVYLESEEIDNQEFVAGDKVQVRISENEDKKYMRELHFVTQNKSIEWLFNVNIGVEFVEDVK